MGCEPGTERGRQVRELLPGLDVSMVDATGKLPGTESRHAEPLERRGELAESQVSDCRQWHKGHREEYTRPIG